MREKLKIAKTGVLGQECLTVLHVLNRHSLALIPERIFVVLL